MTRQTMDLPQEPGAAWPTGKVGYVALLGRPNAGKSTLLNTVLSYRLAAVSPKPQTTRRRWLGILSDADSQILFLDTPGVHIPKHALGQAMAHSIQSAIDDADVLVCLIDPTRPPGEEDRLVAETVAGAAKEVVLAVNKTDIATPEQIDCALAFYSQQLPERPIFRVCALASKSLVPLVDAIKSSLPSGPFFYSPENITDAVERDIASEIIREVALGALRQEVPHAIAVAVEEWEEHGDRRNVRAVLHVERQPQKLIVVGKGGSTIKAIRAKAERELSDQFGPTRLTIWVKVSRDWRRRATAVHDLL